MTSRLVLIALLWMGANSTVALAAVDRAPAATVVARIAGDDTDLELMPKPRQASFSGSALAVGAVEIVAEGNLPAVEAVRALFAESGDGAPLTIRLVAADSTAADRWQPAPEQGYTLEVQAEGDGVSVHITALDGAGFFHAVATLRQLVSRSGGRTWLREARIDDWPAIRYRGVKSAGLVDRYAAYKLNFGWSYVGRDEEKIAGKAAAIAAHVKNHAAHAVSLNPGDVLDPSDEAIGRIARVFAGYHALGTRHFVLSFDDKKARLLEGQGERFSSYAQAQAHVLRELGERVRALGDGSRFYLCHQAYFLGKADDSELVPALVEAGIPQDLQLCWTGSGVFDHHLRSATAQRYAGLFGGRKPSLFYHNWPIEAPKTECRTGPLQPHESGLNSHVDIYMMCSDRDRASEIAFLSGLDWAWNEEGYDPERATRVAARIVAEEYGGAAAYPPLVAIMQWTRTHPENAILAQGQAQAPVEDLAAQVAAERAHYAANLPVLRAHLTDAKLLAAIEKAYEARMRLFDQIVATQRLRRSGVARRTAVPPVIDGSFEDDCWRQAELLDGFSVAGGKQRADPGTEVRVLYDDDHLYVAVRCQEPQVDRVDATTTTGWKIQHRDFIQVNTDHTGEFSRCGFACTTMHGQSSRYDFGQQKSEDFEVKVSWGGDHWSAEFRLPLTGVPEENRPASARTWGFNVIRHRRIKKGPREWSSWSPLPTMNDKFKGSSCGTLGFE